MRRGAARGAGRRSEKSCTVRLNGHLRILAALESVF